MPVDKLDRYRGCLLGGAAGDALGYPVEFLSLAEIRKQYGPAGITEYKLQRGVAQISDDTQMALFTANGLLYNATRRRLGAPGGGPECGVMAVFYQDWLRTQQEPYRRSVGRHFAWLMNVPALYHRRAPGCTCMEAIAQEAWGTPETPINGSKGCGGIMRVVPLALAYRRGENYHGSLEELGKIGAEIVAITHGHPLGYMPAAVLVHIINRILTDRKHISLKEIILEARDTAAKIFRRNPYLRKMTEIIDLAVRLSENNKRDIENIHAFGEGWVAEETLGIALYCALKYQDDFS